MRPNVSLEASVKGYDATEYYSVKDTENIMNDMADTTFVHFAFAGRPFCFSLSFPSIHLVNTRLLYEVPGVCVTPAGARSYVPRITNGMIAHTPSRMWYDAIWCGMILGC